MIKKHHIILFFLLNIILNPTNRIFAQSNYKEWLLASEKDAIEFGISKKTYANNALTLTNYNKKVLSNYANQPEVKITFNKYFDRNVSKKRISKGKVLLEKNLKLLDAIEKIYKVPPEIIVAIWGIETNYGSYTGNYEILDALSTLAYKSNRKAFFKKEFFYALKIIEEKFIDKSTLKGSWAGAMGQSQFMPSSYIYYAVDFNKDNKIDLWNSYPDILASIGNYLFKHGWKEKEPWLYEIDSNLIKNKSIKKKYSINDIYKNHNKRPDIISTHYNKKGSIISYGKESNKRSFLVYSNFFILKKYNNSNFYALTLGELANRILISNAN